MPAPTVTKSRLIASLQELKARGAQELEAAEEILSRCEAADREMTEEEAHEYQAHLDEAEKLRAELAQAQSESIKAAQRAALEDTRAAYGSLPDAGQLLNSPGLARVTRMRANWTQDPQWGFRGAADFAMSVYHASIGGMRDERLDRIAQYQAAMDHNTPQTGGYLMPPAHNSTIFTNMMGRRTNLMALCDLYPLQGNLTIELIANAETSRVAGSRWGGVTSYWVEDGTAMTDSQPKQRLVELRPRQLATLIKVNNTLLNSPMALEAYLDRAAVDDQIQTINAAILRGDGVAKPKGVYNSGSLVTITKEASQAAATIVDDNIHKMWARVLDEENTFWFVNRDAVPELEALAATGISGTIPIMLANQNGYPTMAVPGPQTLKGRPVRRLEQCSTLGTVGDILLANMSGYAMAYRGRGDGGVDGEPGVQRDMSMHLEFDKNRTAFRYIIAVDGQTWLQEAITPENGTNKLSHFIVIETRS